LVKDLGMCCGGAVDVYIEPVPGQERLVIYGAGHIAKPTAAIGRDLGFAVTVVDERDEWATPERFPGCTVLTTDPRAHARAVTTDGKTWILVTTHEHALDQDLLEILVAREYAWLGLVGSRAKVAKFFLRLRAAGVDESHFSKVSAPVGLDLGAETPAEIAVAVAGEIVRARRGGTGRSMSEEPLPARGGDGVGRAPRGRG
jgi:xanthine dehydrogenase accessory factor